MNDFIEFIIKIIFSAIAIILQAFIVSILWGWFVTPAFGIQVFPVPYYIGFTIICSLMIPHNSNESEDEIIYESLFKSMFLSLTFLGIGWIAHLFI